MKRRRLVGGNERRVYSTYEGVAPFHTTVKSRKQLSSQVLVISSKTLNHFEIADNIQKLDSKSSLLQNSNPKFLQIFT